MAAPDGENSASHAIRELLGELTGAEEGILDTLKALRRSPDEVVEDILTGGGTYVSPYRMLIFLAASWVFVMNGLFDWTAILSDGFLWIFEFFEDDSVPPPRDEVLSTLRPLGVFWSTYLVPVSVLYSVVHAGIWTRLTRSYDVSFRRHLAVVCYRNALGWGIGFVAFIGFALHAPATFLLGALGGLAELLGINFVSRRVGAPPVERFYVDEAEAMGRAYRKSGLILVSAVSFLFGVVGFFFGALVALNTKSL